MRSARSGTGWLWLVTLVPAVLIAVLIVRNAVDTLYWDDWRMIGAPLVRASSGELGLEDLVGLHNESRPVFPRIFFLAVGTFTRGDTRWLLPLTFSLACVVSWSIFFLARATLHAGTSRLLGLTFLANLLIFTPKQAETWLWGSYVGVEPVACLTASLSVLYSGLRPARKVAIGAALCTVATFSYTNGLVTWLLVAPVVALAVAPRWLGWWAAGAALNAGLFFHGYVKPAGHPSPLEGLRPLRLATYVLAFLGEPLGSNRLAIATAVGALFSASFALAGTYLLVHRRDVELRRRLTPWLAIGGYALLSGLAAGVGRSPLGVHQAMTNRYIPFSLYLGLALLFIVPIVLAHASGEAALGPVAHRIFQSFAGACLGVCLLLQASAVVIGVRETNWVGRMLLYGKSCLLFIDAQPDEACLSSWVYGNTAYVRQVANDLDRFGYLRPGLVKSRRLQNLRAYGRKARVPGVFERFARRGRRFVASGWAGLPTGAGPADAVILARQDRNGDWVPLRFVPVLSPRPDVSKERGSSCGNCGWRQVLDADELPDRPFLVGAWALDARRGWALPLEGVYTVDADSPGRR
jgi:hypothetical protein